MEITKKNHAFFQKPEKGKMGALLVVFVWFALWNALYLLLHSIWQDWKIQIISWAFFASATLFFMQEELSYRDRFWHTLVGGNVGLLLAAGVILCCGLLTQAGLDQTVALIIPLLAAIAVLILGNAYLPVVFNNVGFIYLIISLIQDEHTISKLPSHMLSLLLGSVILCLGCTVLINTYIKVMTKIFAEK